MAKAAGAKFTFGTNNSGPGDLGRCEYGLRMVEECNLVWQDFFVPLSGPKAIERKGFCGAGCQPAGRLSIGLSLAGDTFQK